MEKDQLPPIPPGIDPAHLHFTPSQATTGEPAPDFTLPLIGERSNGTVTLSALRGKPVVLVFGSFT